MKIEKNRNILLAVIITICIFCVLYVFGTFAQTEEQEESVVVGIEHKQSPEIIQKEQELRKQSAPLFEMKLDASIYQILYSRDDKFLVTADNNGAIKLWDVKNNYSLDYILEGHTKEIYGLDLSGDGKYLASGGADQLIKIWDIENRKLIKTIQDYKGIVSDLSFSPDSSILASANLQNIIELWGIKKGDFYHVTNLAGHKASVYAVSFYPNGLYLASAGKDKEVRIWPLGVDDEIKILIPHTHIVLNLSFSPKGNFLASGSADNTVNLWRVSSQEGKISLSEQPLFSYVHKGWVLRTVFSIDEKYLITSSQYGELRVWDLSSMQLIKVVSVYPNEPIFDIAFSSNGEYLAVGGKSGISVYRWKDIISDSKTLPQAGLKLEGIEYGVPVSR